MSRLLHALLLLTLVACGIEPTAETDEAEPAPEPTTAARMDRIDGPMGPVRWDHSAHMGYGLACADCHHAGMPTTGCMGCHQEPADGDPAHLGPEDNTVLASPEQAATGVAFTHYTHASSQGHKLACETCHHLGGAMPCSTCHREVATRQGEAVVPRHKRAMHLSCKGCHESLVERDPHSTAPVECEHCHRDSRPLRLEGHLSFERALHRQCIDCHRVAKADRPVAPIHCAGCHDSSAATEPETAPETMDTTEPEAAPEPQPEPEVELTPEVEAAPEPEPEPAGPSEVTMPCANGAVVFHHSTHGALGCQSCHPDPWPMARERQGMAAGHAGCSRCHAEDVSSNCARCHQAP